MRTAWLIPFDHGGVVSPDPVSGEDRIKSWGRIGGSYPLADGSLTCVVMIEPWPEHEAAVIADLAARADHIRLPDLAEVAE